MSPHEGRIQPNRQVVESLARVVPAATLHRVRSTLLGRLAEVDVALVLVHAVDKWSGFALCGTEPLLNQEWEKESSVCVCTRCKSCEYLLSRKMEASENE